jgi:hypothetical protein
VSPTPGDGSAGEAGEWLPLALSVSGGVYAATGVIDPRLHSSMVAGPVLALAGLLLARRRHRHRLTTLVLATLACVYALASWTEPDFAADSPSYYVYLRSAAFDHDLDFKNEWDHWQYKEQPVTVTGHRRNVHAVGAAVLWSPFLLVAHVYVLGLRACGSPAYAADGFSAPYLRATALGTATIAVLGALLLARALVPRFGAAFAVIGVVAGTLASPVPYYVLAEPTMAHGLVFGLAATFVWGWIETLRQPTALRWTGLGALAGLLALTRWQAIVFVAMFVPLAVEGFVSRRLRTAWVACAALASLAAFAPQLVAWKILYGRLLAIPAQAHGMDWSSPAFVHVLLAADRGLFTWTPLMMLATVALAGLLFSWPSFASGALAVLAASAWVNGGVKDWAGADAFGARRFDLVVPLLGVALAALAQGTARAVARRPWLVPAAAGAVMVLWNVGLMRLYRHSIVREAAPLDRLAAAQLFQLRKGTEDALERLGGPRARSVAYMFFVGEYFYWNANLAGTIDVGAPEGRYLVAGWSRAKRREGWPAFRWALYPRACVSIPLLDPRDVPVVVTARAPNRLPGQAIGLSMNQGPVSWQPLPTEWTDITFLIPKASANPGDNLLCASFTDHLGGEDEGGDGSAVAAAVSRIALR